MGRSYEMNTNPRPVSGATIVSSKTQVLNVSVGAPPGQISISHLFRTKSFTNPERNTGMKLVPGTGRCTVHLYGRLLYDSGVIRTDLYVASSHRATFQYPGPDLRYGVRGDILTITVVAMEANIFSVNLSCPDRSKP